MKKQIRFKVNGVDRELLVEPWWSLASVLRDQLDLTGTKVGCETGNCGACTVIVDGKTVKSCLFLAVRANNKEVLTIEGLRDKSGEPHPLQTAFVEHFAIQCGYCTPGMIMAAKALLDENPHPTEEDVREAMQGNICRCTGYVKIVEAILAVGDREKQGV